MQADPLPMFQGRRSAFKQAQLALEACGGSVYPLFAQDITPAEILGGDPGEAHRHPLTRPGGLHRRAVDLEAANSSLFAGGENNPLLPP